jgi:hypothetical protein
VRKPDIFDKPRPEGLGIDFFESLHEDLRETIGRDVFLAPFIDRRSQKKHGK